MVLILMCEICEYLSESIDSKWRRADSGRTGHECDGLYLTVEESVRIFIIF